MTTQITEQNISNIRNAGVQWQEPKTSNFTAVAGEGYFVNTSGGAFTMTMPASPVIGDTISVSMITAGNDLTISRNGNNIDGAASDATLGSDGDAKTYVFVNATEGFKTMTSTVAATFITATGGTESTSGNYKIHTFNSSGNFVVTSASNTAADNEASYLVVGGGGAGGVGCSAGGAGAGGYREGVSSVDCYSGSPTAATSGITISAQTCSDVIKCVSSFSCDTTNADALKKGPSIMLFIILKESVSTFALLTGIIFTPTCIMPKESFIMSTGIKLVKTKKIDIKVLNII